MDEGTYLVKGKYYLDGTYQLFEPFGPITNKMPFSFWILGLTQVWFRPGLLSARLFVLILFFLLNVFLWSSVNKIFGYKWAALPVMVISLNPAVIMYYSRANTQIISALFIILSIWLILNNNLKIWNLIVGALCAVSTVLTRQNLLPYYVLYIFFLFWEFG